MRLYNGVRLLGTGPCLSNIERIDLSALPMISRMQMTGLQVDLDHFYKMEGELDSLMDRITEEVHAFTGYYINVGSGDQVSDLLFKKLGLKQARPKMTNSGDRESVENEVLVAIQHDHPVVPLCLEYKEYEKLHGTYAIPIRKLARRVSHDNWRLFPNLGNTRIPSGRCNCSNPNLLAMPNRTEMGRKLCEGFITKPGWCYLSVDQSQIEPRTVAHRSGDQNLRDIYWNQEDIYSDFAIYTFKLEDKRYRDEKGWHYPGVDLKKHRFPSKTCILAWLYDVSASGLLDQMPSVCGNCGIGATKHTCKHYESYWTEDKCQTLIDDSALRYPGVIAMRRMDHGRAKKYGYVWDDWGRILHVAAVRSVLPWVVSAALREASNFPIQSFAQGTVKLTQAAVDDDFLEMGVYEEIVNPLLQEHDEILLEVREDMAQEIGAHIAHRFETCVKLEVPIKANVATAPVWGKLPK